MGILFALFCIYAATLLLPVIWVFINSFKAGNNEFFYFQWQFKGFSIANYTKLFTGENDIIVMLLNTLILALVIPTVSVFLSMCMGHAIGSFNFKLKGIIYFMFLLPMFVSISGSTPYMYKLMNDIGLYDQHLGMVVMACGGYGMGFLMFYSIFKNISHTYSEAAMIDGAGYWRTFLQILSPQAKDLLIAQWVMGFIGTWNDYAGPKLYLPSYPTLGVGVQEISEGVKNANYTYPELFATIIVMLVPIMILFFAFQKKIMTVSLGGGIKG